MTGGLGSGGGEEVQSGDDEPAQQANGGHPETHHPPHEHLALLMQVGPELLQGRHAGCRMRHRIMMSFAMQEAGRAG